MADTQTLDIVIENVGEDVYTLMARGHHDVHAFMRQIRKDGYTWPLGMPEHLWFKAVPTRKPDYHCLYVPVEKETRGAFPVTYVQEAYNEDTYEALAARAQGCPASSDARRSAMQESAAALHEVGAMDDSTKQHFDKL